ncbi:MAG: hypothetical protein E7390_06425 [Ruminococcaceae bacterium]|nr:hypothetical protein [Oscillospiraceae bacterium]
MPIRKKLCVLLLCLVILPTVLVPSAETGPMLLNGSFEELTAVTVGDEEKQLPSAWRFSRADLTSVVTSPSKSGNALQITNIDETIKPFVATDVYTGALREITVSTWVYAIEKKASFVFKFEFYDAEGTHITGAASNTVTVTAGAWQEMKYTFTTPIGCSITGMALRLSGAGTLVFDDVSAEKISEADVLSVMTDAVFYRPERTKPGEIRILLNTEEYPGISGIPEVTFSDGETEQSLQVYAGETENEMLAVLPMNLLREQKKAYTITAELAGYKAVCTNVYKYARPERLDGDGVYVVNGKKLPVVFAYRWREADYKKGAAHKMTVAQVGTASALTGEELLADLERKLIPIKEAGIYAMVTLYQGGFAAGNPAIAEKTRLVVERFKDEEAIFGWMIMDEAFSNNPNPQGDLEASYTLIRNIDDMHPVMLNEATLEYQREAGKYTDILLVDPYPNPLEPGREAETFPFARVSAAVEAVDGEKPVYAILQAYARALTETYTYYPSDKEIRNMLYQSFIAGAKGVGFYNFATDKYDTVIEDAVKWNELCTFFDTEMDMFFDTFVCGENKLFSVTEEKDCNWRLWQTQDGIFYLAAQNKTKQSTSFSFPFYMKNFTVEAVRDKSETDKITHNAVQNTLTVALEPTDAILFRITPDAAARENSISLYDDAGNGIEVISGKGNVHVYTYNEKPGTMWAALYEEGAEGKNELIGIDRCETKGNFSYARLYVPNEKKYFVKVFYWKDLQAQAKVKYHD